MQRPSSKPHRERTPAKGERATKRKTVYETGWKAERTAARFVDARGVWPEMKAIADTGFLYAFLSSDDLHHHWAVELAGELSEPAFTCESVLAETAYHLRSADAVLELMQAELIVTMFDFRANLGHLHELALRYVDRQPDLADLCLVRMSELFPDRVVLTTDEKDFRVYRRNKRDVIPLVCPPRLRR